jgi:hypothetical protein
MFRIKKFSKILSPKYQKLSIQTPHFKFTSFDKKHFSKNILRFDKNEDDFEEFKELGVEKAQGIFEKIIDLVSPIGWFEYFITTLHELNLPW